MRQLSKDITLAECQQFKAEHPTMSRTQLTSHHIAMYKAMKRLDVLDELYPSQFVYHKDITAEDCERFKQEHPDISRTELREKHLPYYKATVSHQLLDKLYPSRLYDKKYTEQELIDIARQYEHIKDLRAANKKIAIAIQKYGIADKAYAHMKQLGDDKHKLIYAFEFADHSVYVGLTYNLALRQHRHLHGTNRYSAVREHIENTGLQPTLKQLTELLDVEEAARMEGEWVEKYRSEGWTILNKIKTGGVGTVHNRKNDDEAILKLASDGYSIKGIARKTGASERYVHNLLRDSGIDTHKPQDVPVEIIDKQGAIVRTFPSLLEAKQFYGLDYHWGLRPLNIHLRLTGTGLTARYNEEKYIIRHGRRYGEKK